MKRYLLTAVFGIGLTISSNAQSFEWAKQFGGPGGESGAALATDGNGNVYTIGQFTTVIDVNPGVPIVNFTSSGPSDIYLSKVDAAGNFLWAAQFGGTWNDFSVSITVDKDDNVICSGIFDGTADFDPGAGTYNMTSTSGGETFTLKLDSAGNFLWAIQRTGYSGIDRNNAMGTDSLGNIYATGPFAGTSDFDPGVGINSLTTIGDYDAFVQKLDPNGNLLWVRQMGGSQGDAVPYGMDVDAAGNIFITGYYTDTIDFNPSMAMADTMNLIGEPNGDAFVVRMDNGGGYVWAAAFNGAFQGYGFDIEIDKDLNVYSTGNFEATMDFDPGGNVNTLNSPNGTAAYVSKLDASGNFIWADMLVGASSNTYGDGLALDKYNNVYVTGRFEGGQTDFDPGAGTYNLAPAGSNDVYITKLTSTGNFVWAKQFGGIGYDVVGGMTVDAAGNIYANGLFGDVADFDSDAPVFNLTPVAGNDAYLFKIFTCYMGAGVTQTGGTLTVDVVSGPVQWVDCNNGYAPIAGETNQSFTPTMNGDYAAVISFMSCVDTSICFTVSTAGINEMNVGLNIAVYPNPTATSLTIQTNEIIENVFIYDIMGSLVQTETKTHFSVENLAVGMYLLQVHTDDGIKTMRFIKE